MDNKTQNSSQSFQDYKTHIGHYSTLTEALAAAMLKGNLVWRIYDETREPYDLVEIYDFAKKYDQEHPITGTQFYWVSREGAIGISMGLEYRVKWMFIPMEPGLERDDLIEKMGERLVDVEGVKEALGTETETATIVPPPILPSEPAMPPQPEPGPEPQLQPEPMPQPAPMPEPQPQPARQPEPQPVQGIAVQQPHPAPQPAAQSGGKSKLPLILGGAVAALLIVGGGYYAFSHFAGSQETPAQQEEATATTAPSEPATAEPATPATPAAADAKALTTAALDELKSAATARQGIDKLNQAIANGGKESVEALYTLAQLYGRVYKEKDVLAHVENLLPKDTKKAHELNEKAVALDPAYYPSLYELGCDYMAGDARGAVDRDIDKAKQYFTQGAKYAQQASDIQFSERFEIRLSSLE